MVLLSEAAMTSQLSTSVRGGCGYLHETWDFVRFYKLWKPFQFFEVVKFLLDFFTKFFLLTFVHFMIILVLSRLSKGFGGTGLKINSANCASFYGLLMFAIITNITRIPARCKEIPSSLYFQAPIIYRKWLITQMFSTLLEFWPLRLNRFIMQKLVLQF